MEITKICKKCGEDKPLSYYSYHKEGLYQKRSRCKSCLTIEDRLYTQTPKRKEAMKIKNKNNVLTLRKTKSKSLKKSVDELTDSYILKGLVNQVIKQVKINRNDIPQEIIDLKRVLIKTHRLCQQLQN
jgi:hypothetical protein